MLGAVQGLGRCVGFTAMDTTLGSSAFGILERRCISESKSMEPGFYLSLTSGCDPAGRATLSICPDVYVCVCVSDQVRKTKHDPVRTSLKIP